MVVQAPYSRVTRKFLENLRKYFPVKYVKADDVQVFLIVRYGRKSRKILVLKGEKTGDLFRFWKNYEMLKREQWWWKWKL